LTLQLHELELKGQTFANALTEYSGTVEVSAIGYLIDGDAVAGSDLVRIVN
jgi:hypothetical protein